MCAEILFQSLNRIAIVEPRQIVGPKGDSAIFSSHVRARILHHDATTIIQQSLHTSHDTRSRLKYPCPYIAHTARAL